jgi:hypothetical protein
MESSGATNPFEAEWRACLEAHLQHVLVTGDKSNEITLLEVLKIAGFTDSEVSHLRRMTLGLPEEEPTPTEAPPVEVEAEASAPTADALVVAEVVADSEDTTMISVSEALPEPAVEREVAVEADAATTVHMDVDAPHESEASAMPQQPPPQQLSLF